MIRVTLTVDGVTATIANEHPLEGPTISEVGDILRQALLGVGFHPDNVKDLFAEEN